MIGVRHSRWRELFDLLRVALEFDQGRKQQDHVPPFVHDRRSTVAASDLAWQLVPRRLLATVIPDEIVVPLCEIDVLLVEDSGPLKGSA